MNLRIPGPTPCPDEVLRAMSEQMINHRGKEFAEMINEETALLKEFFQTKGDLFILTAAGTGGMEAAIVNTLSPGDKVLSVSIGVFGDRFAKIAETYGANVVRLSFPWGTTADPKAIDDALTANADVKAVLVTHNETSTGVTNDIQAISRAVKQHDKLLLVDSISGLGSLTLPVDDWNLDVAVAGSQKGWMVPPGLVFVSVSDKAWEANSKAEMPRFYMDLKQAKSYLEKAQTPWTPAVSVMYGLRVALRMMAKEGLSNIIARHERIGKTVREGVKSMGLSLFAADEKYASNTVTAVTVPEGVDCKKLLTTMREEKKVVLAGGQSKLDGKIIRIGHLGYITDSDVDQVLASLREVLPKMGFQVK